MPRISNAIDRNDILKTYGTKGEDSRTKDNHEVVADVQRVSHWCASIRAKGQESYPTGGGLHHFDMTLCVLSRKQIILFIQIPNSQFIVPSTLEFRTKVPEVMTCNGRKRDTATSTSISCFNEAESSLLQSAFPRAPGEQD